MELEICVDSVESAIAAELGGAQRVELCSALADGGITPSAALIRAVRAQIKISLYVMIRPRSADFVYSDEEVSVMRQDIEFAAQSGADGVVFGLLKPDGNIDVERTRALVELAHRSRSREDRPHPVGVTFHRAIDMSRDIGRSLEDVIQTGADRILTSGAEPSAAQGIETIKRAVVAARGRIKIMVGGGIRARNLSEIATRTGAVEFHAALRSTAPSPVTFRKDRMHLGDPLRDEYVRSVVLAEDVRELREAMNAITVPKVRKIGSLLMPAEHVIEDR